MHLRSIAGVNISGYIMYDTIATMAKTFKIMPTSQIVIDLLRIATVSGRELLRTAILAACRVHVLCASTSGPTHFLAESMADVKPKR
jgi:hypothetical protein